MSLMALYMYIVCHCSPKLSPAFSKENIKIMNKPYKQNYYAYKLFIADFNKVLYLLLFILISFPGN